MAFLDNWENLSEYAQAQIQEHYQALMNIINKPLPDHFDTETWLGKHFDGLYAMAILDRVVTDEQLQALGFIVVQRARWKPSKCPQVTQFGIQYLISSIRTGIGPVPMAYDGISLCRCDFELGAILQFIAEFLNPIIEEHFPGAELVQCPDRMTCLDDNVLFRDYPKSLVRIVRYLDDMGAFDILEELEPLGMEEIRHDFNHCNTCRILYQHLYEPMFDEEFE